MPELQQFPLWKTTFGGSLGGKGATIGGARSVEKNTIGKNQTRFLVVQTGESIGQAKVFKAQAVPQGLCGNLINALMLLPNQQEDGDGLIQNIVRNLGKGSRKGLTEGLTEFKKFDNERALEVGYLNRGMGKFTVRKPKVPEGCPEVTVRESTVTKSSDELTLRAEEVTH